MKNPAFPRSKPCQDPTVRQTQRDLRIKYLNIESVIPAKDNPRSHSRRQIQLLKDSINAFGFLIPLIIDTQHQIVCGHARFEAARVLALETVPCIIVDDLSDTEIRAFRIADNRLAEHAEWNEKQLAEDFKILSDLDLDFSLDLIGFSAPERESLIVKFEEIPEGSDGADAVGTVEDVPAVCQAGDLWQMGNHVLYCGDATEPASYDRLLGSDLVDMVFTDPPYNVSSRHIGKVCAAEHGDFSVAGGEMSSAEYRQFLEATLGHLCERSVDGSLHFICQDWRHMGEILSAGNACYTELKNLCVWAKDTPGMGKFYRSQHELVFVFKHGKARHRNNFQLGQYGRSRSNVWRYPSVRSFSEFDGNPPGRRALSLHPTIKPVQLIADAVLDCSLRGDVVLDPFLGSGSTLIACERTHRVCHGIELNPRYVDVAIDRWQSWTGETAIHSDSGNTFQERAGGSLGVSESSKSEGGSHG